MRIGVLTSLYPGTTRPNEGVFAERRWLGMQERGHEVLVVQPMPHAPLGGWGGPRKWREIAGLADGEDRGGITVHRPRYVHVPKRARANAARFARAGVARMLSAARPEVVVCDYAWPAAAAVPAFREAGVACVVNGRGSDVLQVAGEAGLGADLAKYLSAADGWCAVSQDLVRAMDELAGAQRGVLVPNGVDLDRFTPRDRDGARTELGLDPHGAVVLVVGHWIPRKDPALAARAFRAGAPDDARLILLGRGELEGELAQLAREDSRIRLVGEVSPDALATWYAASDLLLLTSRREGRPNVVLESLASGRPVLATDAGGTAELLVDAPEMLSRSREPAELGARLAALLADSPEAERCRSLVEAYSWDASLTALERVLQSARERAA